MSEWKEGFPMKGNKQADSTKKEKQEPAHIFFDKIVPESGNQRCKERRADTHLGRSSGNFSAESFPSTSMDVL